MYLGPSTRAQDTPSVAAACGRRSTKSGSPIPCELPRLRMTASFRRSGSTSPSMTRAPSFAGCCWSLRMNHRVTVRQIPRRRGGSRGTPTAPNDVQKRNITRSLPVLKIIASSSRRQGYRRSIAPGQPGCSHGAPSASRPHTWSRSGHGLPSGHHGPGKVSRYHP
jgi:hypothetical protein